MPDFPGPPPPPPVPTGAYLYCFEGWDGTLGNGNWSSGSVWDGDIKTYVATHSRGVRHALEDGGSIEVTSHFLGNYDELKEWAPINTCLYESRQLDVSARKAEKAARQMQSDLWNGTNPFVLLLGSIDDFETPFEVVKICSSFVAIAHIESTVIHYC